MDLRPLLRPRSVAVVGATDRAGAYGSEALLNFRRLAFPGTVYAVNPGRESVHGLPCHATLSDLPEVPDAVIVAIPADGVPAVVEEAGALGCGGAVVLAAGFAEAPDGAARQAALAEAARRHALPVCGPNGNGVVSLHAGTALWGDMVTPLPPGPVALISQSGNIAVNTIGSRRGLRLHTVVSCGNQAVVTAADWLEALADEDGVRSVALYVEDAGDPERWRAALARCAEARVSVAVLKAGTSAAGAAAARAHTGARAGDVAAFRALMEEAGALWATDADELLELAKALAVAGERRGGPAGIAVMGCSGGDAAIAADLAAELGVPLPELAPGTVDALRTVLPPAATAQNPLDYTALLWRDPPALQQLALALARDPAVGRVIVVFDEPEGLDGAAAEQWAAVRGAAQAAALEADVPILVVATLPELMPDATAVALAADGLPGVGGLRSGIRCAAALATAWPPAG